MSSIGTATKRRDPDALKRLDKAHDALEKLHFLSDLCAAWDMESVELSQDNLRAMSLILDEATEAIEETVASL